MFLNARLELKITEYQIIVCQDVKCRGLWEVVAMCGPSADRLRRVRGLSRSPDDKQFGSDADERQTMMVGDPCCKIVENRQQNGSKSLALAILTIESLDNVNAMFTNSCPSDI